MFQKCSLKQAAVLQLSKAITLIVTVLKLLQRKLSIHAVQCSVTFQNSVKWLIKNSTLTRSLVQSISLKIKAMFNYCNLQLV